MFTIFFSVIYGSAKKPDGKKSKEDKPILAGLS